MNYKMIIFDLDGTILNTIEDLCASCNAAFLKYDIKPIDVPTTMKHLGHGIRHLVYETSGHSLLIEELLSTFKKYYAAHYNDYTKPYEGIISLLDWCLAQSIQIGVLTNKVEDIALKLCSAHFGSRFQFVYGEKEGRKRKPDPTFLLELIDSYHLKKDEVIYIGDSEVDIETCNNAGILGLFVDYGFRSKEELLKKTDILFDSPQQIIDFLKR